MPPRCTADWLSAILKLTPCSVFKEDIWEGRTSLLRMWYKNWKVSICSFPTLSRSSFSKEKGKEETPQIETYPKKEHDKFHFPVYINRTFFFLFFLRKMHWSSKTKPNSKEIIIYQFSSFGSRKFSISHIRLK